MAQDAIACVPMKLDCLVMNEKVAGSDSVKVAPITQPNYTFLRLETQTIQSDVIPFTNLHYTTPVNRNQRLTDLGTGQRRTWREGVYVSWIMPRAYRMGVAGTPKASSEASRVQQGYPPLPPKSTPDFSAPDFRPAPTRWLIVRRIDPSTLVGLGPIADTEKARLELQAWVLESDRLSKLEDIPFECNGRKVDLQTDYSPFVIGEVDANIEQQAEVFIGWKEAIQDWTEQCNGPKPPSRVPLSLLNSSNQLFADYQPHNSNVFSMIDEMMYTDPQGTPQKIQSVVAHYYVIGWHADHAEDPFYMNPNVPPVSRSQRMSDIAMQLKDAKVKDASDWAGIIGTSTLLCHGAMYGVRWTMSDTPVDTKAQQVATVLAEKTPVAVGTSAADSLLTLVKAHVDHDDGDLKRLEQDLLKLQTLILARDNGIDGNVEAQDLLEDYAFHGFDGGVAWHFSEQPTSSFNPTQPQTDTLSKLNAIQAAIDNNIRTMQRVSWDLFSIWWKYLSGITLIGGLSPRQLQEAVASQQARWDNLSTTTDTLRDELKLVLNPDGSTKFPAKQGTYIPFSQRNDPTLLIAGAQAGWPSDYLDSLQIRTHLQTVGVADVSTFIIDDRQYETFRAMIVSKLPEKLQQAADNLLLEFSLLQVGQVVSKDCVVPLYHDQPDTIEDWRDQWQTQPWFPLFIEWTGEYYHIPYENFTLDSRPRDKVSSYIRWGIENGVSVDQLPQDLRTVSGRCLILPQPTFSLANAVEQLITNMGSNLPLDPAEIEFLKDKKNFNILPYLSSTMTGLTPHLTTRIVGTHIKPTQRPRGQTIRANDAAVKAVAPIKMNEKDIAIRIGQETSLTPYSISVQLDANTASGLSPFKPVSHGQFRFTQLNILDKFGRAICVLDPSPDKTAGRKHIAPCLSSLYTCQLREIIPEAIPSGSKDSPPGTPKPPINIPNTITHDMGPSECEYSQIPPSVNQPARINLAFCKPNPKIVNQWVPLNDWEPPAYGWVVMNYADYGMQFFTADGTFYRELRFGGPDGITASPAWAPFPRPSNASTTPTTQLDLVINALLADENPGYMKAFYNMITFAFGDVQVPNSSYAQYINSIIGRPLALVNIGISLELASYPLSNESNVSGLDAYSLLPPDDSKDPGESSDSADGTPPKPKTQQYRFPVQVGDQQRSFDGMFGFWKPKSRSEKPVSVGLNFDYQRLFTFWNDVDVSSNVSKILPSTLTLRAFYVAPDVIESTNHYAPVSPQNQVDQRNAELQLISALVDPFRAIHAFSGTVPTVAISLPSWATEAALNRMTAFFHMGPVVLTENVPPFNSQNQLTPDSDIKTIPPAGTVGLPSLNTGQWRWLQPYEPPSPPPAPGTANRLANGRANTRGETPVEAEDLPPPAMSGRTSSTSRGSLPAPGSDQPGSPDSPTPVETNYMPLGLKNVDGRPRFETPPYVAVEGYLQLIQPLTNEKPAAGSS